MKKLLLILFLLNASEFYAQYEYLFQRINDNYYYRAPSEFPNFYADVNSEYSVLDDDNPNGIYPKSDSVHLLLDFYPNQECKIKFLSFTSQYDAERNKWIKNSEKMIGLAIDMWKGFTFSHLLTPGNINYTVEEFDDAYEINENTDKGRSIFFINSEFTIDSMLIIGSSLAILKPSFKIYKNKLLLDSVNYYMDYNILTIDFQIKYKEIGKYIIPEIIVIEEKWKGGKMKVKAMLSNITFNK